MATITMWGKLADINKRYQELEKELASPEGMADRMRLQALAKERSDIADLAEKYQEHQKIGKSLEETKTMLSGQVDDEMKDLVKEEIAGLEAKKLKLAAMGATISPTSAFLVNTVPSKGARMRVFSRATSAPTTIAFATPIDATVRW